MHKTCRSRILQTVFGYLAFTAGISTPAFQRSRWMWLMSLLASFQLSNITQHFLSITAAGRGRGRLTNVVVPGWHSSTSDGGSDRDRSASYVHSAFCLRRATTTRRVIKNRPRNKTFAAGPASADLLDGVLRSGLDAIRRARGRWPGNRNQGATVRRRLVYAAHNGRRMSVRPSVCPPFRSINDAMHILRRSHSSIICGVRTDRRRTSAAEK